MPGLSQFGKFLLVGAFATALQYVVLALLVQTAGMDPVLASSIGYLLSALANYDLNYRLTFRSHVPSFGGMFSFGLVAASSLDIDGSGVSHVGLQYGSEEIRTYAQKADGTTVLDTSASWMYWPAPNSTITPPCGCRVTSTVAVIGW